MDAAKAVLEEWLPVDHQIRHQVDNMKPGDVLEFAVMRNQARIALLVSYDEVMFVKAKLVLLGKIK